MTVPISQSTVSIGGLVFGAAEPSGVTWGIDDVQGWGSPASTVQVVQKPRATGGWAGQGYLPARVIAVTGWVSAPTTALLSDAVDRLAAAVTLTDTPLTVVEAGRSRYCTVRRQGEVLSSMFSDTAANWSIQVVALDPRRYGTTVTGSTTLPSSSGGLTWPVTFPATWTGVTNSGTVSITNSGNTQAPVKLRINGPISGATITHTGAGAPQVFATSLVLGTGEFLTVDMDSRQVLAQGQTSRNAYVTSRGFFSADPGPNQYGFQTPNAYNSTASLTVTVPSGAWL
jgi:hypothetical protein